MSVQKINTAKVSQLNISDKKGVFNVDPSLPSFDDLLGEEMQKVQKTNQQAVLVAQAAGLRNQQNAADIQSQLFAQAIGDDELRRLEGLPAQEIEEELTAENVNEQLRSDRLEITPFQLFLDKSVEALEGISELEHKTNDLIEQFVQGKVSIDEVSIEVNKLNAAISFATTVISTASQTFKEFIAMQI